MVSGITPCAQECKWIVYFGETPKAFSTDTVNAANSLKYWLWVARFLVFFHKYSMGWSSGEYDGSRCTVIRCQCVAKNCWVDSLV